MRLRSEEIWLANPCRCVMFRKNCDQMNTRIVQILTAACLTFTNAVYAQLPGTGGSGGMNAALLQLFSGIPAFTAKADVQVLDPSDKEIATMPMNFAYLDNKIRVEIDLAQAKSSSMPPGAAEQLKQLGMAQVVSIVRPDKKQIYVIYPDQKAVMTMPLAADDAGGKEAKLARAEVAKETVDGHPCIKNKVTIDDGKGQKMEATTWDATDLKKFPIRIQTKEKENTSIVNFKNVQFAKPEAGKFDPPSGYTAYSSPQELMQGILAKAAQGAEKK